MFDVEPLPGDYIFRFEKTMVREQKFLRRNQFRSRSQKIHGNNVYTVNKDF